MKTIHKWTYYAGCSTYLIGTISQNCYFYLHMVVNDPGGKANEQGIYLTLEKGDARKSLPIVVEAFSSQEIGNIGINLVKGTKLSIYNPAGVNFRAYVQAYELYLS